jgi:hypothetical protein
MEINQAKYEQHLAANEEKYNLANPPKPYKQISLFKPSVIDKVLLDKPIPANLSEFDYLELQQEMMKCYVALYDQ